MSASASACMSHWTVRSHPGASIPLASTLRRLHVKQLHQNQVTISVQAPFHRVPSSLAVPAPTHSLLGIFVRLDLARLG